MISEEKMEEFCEKAKEKLFFYIESKFWSKPSIEELNNWLSNFKSIQEKYCATKLLDRFVYYSEEDIIRLIEYGLYEKILKRQFLEIELKNSFTSTNKQLYNEKKVFFKNLRVVPLYTGNQSESSLAMLRYLTNSIGFPEDQILDLNNLKKEMLNDCKNLVIIDDFIGSGTQIQDFWNSKKIVLDGEELYFNQLKEIITGIQIEYFCLVCTEEGYDKFKYNYETGNRNDLRITYSEMLGNRFKVFSKDSTYFDNEEVEECKNILQNLCDQNDIDLLGYHGLDYAVAFHHSIPDCSLPLFYIQNGNWNYLFRNKKTPIYDNI